MARQGAGLGLAISKAYVEMLGGKIWVESQVGSGSNFYFSLPYSSGTQEKSTSNLPDENAFIPLKKLNVLIAEDDETSEMLISISIKAFCNVIIVTIQSLFFHSAHKNLILHSIFC